MTHGVGWCAPQQGACKLSLNVKNGVIEEALVETIGCSGMTHSAAMAAEILPGKTILEALNTDLVCDAINTAMRELFLQIVYGRTQSAFSDDGLRIGAGLEDLGKGLRCHGRHHVRHQGQGHPLPGNGRGLCAARWRWTRTIRSCGYQFLSLGKMMDAIKKGMSPNEAYEKNIGTYGRFKAEDGAVKWIDPRQRNKKEACEAMALFEDYEGRMPQLQPVLDKYGFKDFEEVKAYNNAKGVDAYQHRREHPAHLL